MSNNPLLDIVEKAKQQKYNDDLAEIKKAVDLLLKGQKSMALLITLTNSNGQKIAMNPRYIRSVKPREHDEGSIIWPVTGDFIYVKETVEQIVERANSVGDIIAEDPENPGKKYIG